MNATKKGKKSNLTKKTEQVMGKKLYLRGGN